jgi:hypothetical protein
MTKKAAHAMPTDITLDNADDSKMVAYLMNGMTSASIPKATAACSVVKEKNAAKKVVWLSIAACTMVSEVVSNINQKFSKEKLAPELCQTDDETPNMSLLSLIGHAIFLLEVLPKALDPVREAYKSSLGGSANIKVFGAGGTITGKTKRTELCRKWATMFIANVEEEKAFILEVAKLVQLAF